MPSWLRRLWSRPPAPPREALPPGGCTEPPAWAAPLLDLVQKSSRAQARASLKLEDLEHKLEGGFSELRALVRTSPASSLPAPGLDWAELFDALDLLDEAARAAERTAPQGLAAGLRGVTDRLERFLAQAGLRRLAPVGVAPDGRLFRVVGVQPQPEAPEGLIARVVRAAVLQGEQVVREGEVLVTRSAP